jgi:hypothetical protein
VMSYRIISYINLLCCRWGLWGGGVKLHIQEQWLEFWWQHTYMYRSSHVGGCCKCFQLPYRQIALINIYALCSSACGYGVMAHQWKIMWESDLLVSTFLCNQMHGTTLTQHKIGVTAVNGLVSVNELPIMGLCVAHCTVL